MKNLRDELNESLNSVNEARNYPYYASLLTENGQLVDVTILLSDPNPKNAKILDQWLREQQAMTIIHSDGGPNNIEL